MLIVAAVPAGYLEPVALVPSAPLRGEALALIAALGVHRVVIRDYAGDHLLRLDEAREMRPLEYGRERADPSRGSGPGSVLFPNQHEDTLS